MKAKEALEKERPITEKAAACANHYVRIHAASKPYIGCLGSYHVLESRMPSDSILAQLAHWKRPA